MLCYNVWIPIVDMSCYITCYVIQQMLYDICYGMLYNMCYVMLYNMWYITCVMLCDITYDI